MKLTSKYSWVNRKCLQTPLKKWLRRIDDKKLTIGQLTGYACSASYWKWDTVIQKKTEELGRFLLGKSESVDFTEPVPKIVRSDSLEMRKRILELNQKNAKELGISKSTLSYLHKNAKENKTFRVYEKVAARLR